MVHIKKINELVNENILNDKSSSLIDFSQYIYGRFDVGYRLFEDAPIGTIACLSSPNTKMFWDDDCYTWHYLVKDANDMWTEIEKWRTVTKEHQPVENGIVLPAKDMYKCGKYEVRLAIPLLDKGGNQLCIPAYSDSADSLLCRSSSTEKLSSIVSRAKSRGWRITGRTMGEGKRATITVGHGDSWLTLDTDELRRAVL